MQVSEELRQKLAVLIGELAPRYHLQGLSLLDGLEDPLELLADFGQAPVSLIDIIALEQELTDRLGRPVRITEQACSTVATVPVWHAA